MVCLFLDQVGESWTEAGYCPTSSSCPAGPIKTSRPSRPAAAATSFHMAASVNRTLPGPAGRLNGLPLAVPLSVFTLVLDWILSLSCVPTLPGAEESLLEPSGTRKEAGTPIPGEATISPVPVAHTGLRPVPRQRLQERTGGSGDEGWNWVLGDLPSGSRREDFLLATVLFCLFAMNRQYL